MVGDGRIGCIPDVSLLSCALYFVYAYVACMCAAAEMNANAAEEGEEEEVDEENAPSKKAILANFNASGIPKNVYVFCKLHVYLVWELHIHR